MKNFTLSAEIKEAVLFGEHLHVVHVRVYPHNVLAEQWEKFTTWEAAINAAPGLAKAALDVLTQEAHNDVSAAILD